MSASGGTDTKPSGRFTWGENDLPDNTNKERPAYPEWVKSPEDPKWKPFIEHHFNTRIFTPYEIAECLEILDVSILKTTGTQYLSCITSAGHHSITIMPSHFEVRANIQGVEGVKTIPSHVKSVFIIRGPNPYIGSQYRWCHKLNRISNSECRVQLAYAQLMQTIYDIFYSNTHDTPPDGPLGPLQWKKIVDIFNSAMKLGQKEFGADMQPYIDQAKELLLLPSNRTPEYMLSYINLVQLMTELYLEDKCFREVQPDTYTVGSLSGVDFNDKDYVRTDGVETSEEIKKAAFQLIIMIEVDDGSHKCKIRMAINRAKLQEMLRGKLRVGENITRISYWVGQFIEFTTTHEFIEIVIKLLKEYAAAAVPDPAPVKAKAAATSAATSATAALSATAADEPDAARAARALETVLKVSKSKTSSDFNKGCINTAITSGCKGPDLFFCTLQRNGQIYEKLSRIIRPSFNISSGDIVIAYYRDIFMILKNDHGDPYTHTEYTNHFILCNQFVIPSTNSTCSDRVHYYCILPSQNVEAAAAAAARQPLPYFFLDYDHRLIDESIGISTGDFIDSLTPQVNSQSQQNILAEASQFSSFDDAEVEAARLQEEEEKRKAEAEAKKAEKERLKAEAEAKKAEEERLKAEAESVTGAGSGGNSYLGSNSFLGSIMNSVCSFFRSARVSFDTKPDPDTGRINIIIGSGLNFRKMLIMFVLEAADRYDRRVDAANDDADALVLVTNFALDAAFQLKFLFHYERRIVTLPITSSSLPSTTPDMKRRVAVAGPDFAPLTIPEGTKSNHLDNIASHVCFCAELIHSEIPKIEKSSKDQREKISELINCAYLVTMAARIVAYCCALIIMNAVDKDFERLTSDYSHSYIKPGGLKGVYLPNVDKVNLAQLKALKEFVNTNTIPLLRPFSTKTFVDLENIVSENNVLAAKGELNTVEEILQPTIKEHKLKPDDPVLSSKARGALLLLSNAKNNFEATRNLCSRLRTTSYSNVRSSNGGSSRNKSRKNVKKNTRRNKKFRMSSKTKKQRRRGYSRRRLSYSRKNSRRRQ
jgi:hypothetical protein